MLTITDIQKILPHKYPFLLIDKITDIEPQKNAVSLKNVTINEPFFQGHFPNDPVMPGVLILEAMAQTATILLVHSGVKKDKFSFKAVDMVKFRHPVVPGDQLIIKVKVVEINENFWSFEAMSYIGETLTTEAKFKAHFNLEDNK